jgi:hypothetical protein
MTMDDDSTCDVGETAIGADDMQTIDEGLEDELSDGIPVAREENPDTSVGPDAITGRFTKPRVRAS